MTDATSLMTTTRRVNERNMCIEKAVDYWLQDVFPLLQTKAQCAAKSGLARFTSQTPFDFGNVIASDGISIREKVQNLFPGCRIVFQEIRNRESSHYEVNISWDLDAPVPPSIVFEKEDDGHGIYTSFRYNDDNDDDNDDEW